MIIDRVDPKIISGFVVVNPGSQAKCDQERRITITEGVLAEKVDSTHIVYVHIDKYQGVPESSKDIKGSKVAGNERSGPTRHRRT